MHNYSQLESAGSAVSMNTQKDDLYFIFVFFICLYLYIDMEISYCRNQEWRGDYSWGDLGCIHVFKHDLLLLVLCNRNGLKLHTVSFISRIDFFYFVAKINLKYWEVVWIIIVYNCNFIHFTFLYGETCAFICILCKVMANAIQVVLANVKY